MEQEMSFASRGDARLARYRSRSPQSRLAKIVADAFGVEPAELVRASRGCAQVALVRQAAMYLARVSLGMTLSEAAGLFGRDRTTAAHACRVIEDRRDDFSALRRQARGDQSLLAHVPAGPR